MSVRDFLDNYPVKYSAGGEDTDEDDPEDKWSHFYLDRNAPLRNPNDDWFDPLGFSIHESRKGKRELYHTMYVSDDELSETNLDDIIERITNSDLVFKKQKL